LGSRFTRDWEMDMADKTAGDYAVEIDKATVNNSMADVGPIIDEMRKAAPPATEPPAEPPAPVDQGLAAYADKLEQCVATANMEEMRKTTEEMKTVAPPTPPAEPPAAPAEPPAQPSA